MDLGFKTYRELAAFRKSIIMGPEGESLGDVSSSSCKLNPELGRESIMEK